MCIKDRLLLDIESITMTAESYVTVHKPAESKYFDSTVWNSSTQDYESRFGAAETYATFLFQRSTGQPLPDGMRIWETRFDPWLAVQNRYSGYSLGAFERVHIKYSETRSYACKLTLLAHELGHQICSIGEGGVLTLDFDYELGIMPREEASAYIFTAIMISHISDPALKIDCENNLRESRSVSYTHLTLPTICSV